MVGVNWAPGMPGPANPHSLTGLVHDVVVDPQYRRQKYGQQLFKHMMLFCRQEKIGFLFLTATSMGSPLYRKFGFRECGEEAFELWWDAAEKIDFNSL